MNIRKNILTVSLIVTTYNRPDALRVVLQALARQTVGNFEVIVADDGSDDETRELIASLKPILNYDLKHVWQPHDGFRAATIRNKAVSIADGDYLIFLDGDCIPLVSFVERHVTLSECKYFVRGNRVLLSPTFTENIFKYNIVLQRWRIWNWLYAFFHGWINRFLPMIYLGRLYPRRMWPNKWQGAKTCNLGIWRDDFFLINGLDENYNGWGYEDSDLVIRLIRSGVRCKEGSFSVPVVHLWHPSNSQGNELINRHKLEETLASSRIEAEVGVNQYIKN